MQASLLAIDLFHATPAYWFFHECQETEWIEKEKFDVEIFMTDNGLSVGMSLEQRPKVKLFFQSCSHRALHMLEIPWKDYLMEEKKEIIRTWKNFCISYWMLKTNKQKKNTMWVFV